VGSGGVTMRCVVIFDDDPAMADVRARLEPAHLAFLEQHRDEIPMAGGLRDEHGGAYVGGLWVFEVESRARAQALIALDPYQIAHPRRCRLLAWGKALPRFMVTL
jgi:uncharacterized protein